MLNRNVLASLACVALLGSSAIAQHNHSTPELPAQSAGQPVQESPAAAEIKPKADVPRVGAHGGILQQLGDLTAEVLVEPSGLRLFLHDPQGRPVELSRARGLATLQVQGSSKRYRYELFPVIRKDQTAEVLAAAVDLRRLAGQAVEIGFQLKSVPGEARKPLTFTASTVAPISEQQRVTAAIAAQQVCPVSGQPLGSMGAPIPVTIDSHTIYVCCAGCIDAVKANPNKYLANKLESKVVPITEVDAKFVAAQKLCPVLDMPLDSMGGPYKTILEGRVVYLCCPGCVKKLTASPQHYFAKLEKQGVTPPKAE